jgi:hypothetical protein
LSVSGAGDRQAEGEAETRDRADYLTQPNCVRHLISFIGGAP